MRTSDFTVQPTDDGLSEHLHVPIETFELEQASQRLRKLLQPGLTGVLTTQLSSNRVCYNTGRSEKGCRAN